MKHVRTVLLVYGACAVMVMLAGTAAYALHGLVNVLDAMFHVEQVLGGFR